MRNKVIKMKEKDMNMKKGGCEGHKDRRKRHEYI